MDGLGIIGTRNGMLNSVLRKYVGLLRGYNYTRFSIEWSFFFNKFFRNALQCLGSYDMRVICCAMQI